MKSKLLFSLFCASIFGISIAVAQAPQGIPYQAVVRNADGSVLSNTAVTLTLMIHDIMPNGTVVYEEVQTATTNAQGLFACTVGNGVVSAGTFTSLNWAAGAKFIHVLVNTGSGDVDLGTQQLLSVPYAVYANDIAMSISATGDTLTIGKNTIIVPGISASNPQALYSVGSGVTDVNGNFYNSIIIGTQEWMQSNLKVTQYSNGDPITLNLSDTEWQASTSGAAANYNDVLSSGTTYGKLYNWYAVNDNRGVCPTGWHVPTDTEWTTLETTLGGASTAGMKLKDDGTIDLSTGLWMTGAEPATNASGFTALPGGYRYFSGTYNGQGAWANFWTNTATGPDYAWDRELFYNNSTSGRTALDKHTGLSVRCLKN